MSIRFKFSHLLDTLWLLALCSYMALGFAYIDFHGDESNHIYMTRDYVTAFVERQPQQLTPLLDENGEYITFYHQLRLIDAPLHGYFMGFAWHLSGLSERDLPAKAWRWDGDFGSNLAEGAMPSESMLFNARAASTFLLCLSVMVMFVFGMQFGGRPMGYFTSALYALHPLILMHGRRAMHEAPLLLFGLLTLLFAALLTRREHWALWLGLIVSGGLAMASKHTGLIYVVGALGWITAHALVKTVVEERSIARFRSIGVTLLKTAASGLLMLAIFIALSPSLWADPPKHIRLLIDLRSLISSQQAAFYVGRTDTLEQRGRLLLEMPFITPLNEWWHVELAPMMVDYRESIWSGVHVGLLGGLLLTMLAVYGMIAALLPRLRPPSSTFYQGLGLMVAVLPVAGMLLMNRLPWQRHYVTIIPFAVLFAGIGAQSLIYLARTAALHARTLAAETP